jgi:hypothetical protein
MNLDRWKHLANPPDLSDSTSMDWRHVQMINAVLTIERPMSVVEIGCGRGFSTSAIIEALEFSKNLGMADLVDIEFTESVKKIVLLSECRDRIYFKRMSSNDYDGSPSVWVIDGDHRGQAIWDYQKAKTAKALVIIMHDTCPQWCPDSQFGSIEAGKMLRNDCRVLFEDYKERPGELTHRGLTIGFFYQPGWKILQRLEELAQ